MIKVDVGEPTAETPQGLAQKIVQGTGGVILPEPVNFDGTTGVSVMTNSKDLKMPKHFVILMRRGKVYLVMVAETEGTDVLNAMQKILDTWKWRDQNPGQSM